MINKNILFYSLLMLTYNFFASQNLDLVKNTKKVTFYKVEILKNENNKAELERKAYEEENKAPLYFLSLCRKGNYVEASKFLVVEAVKEQCPIQ